MKGQNKKFLLFPVIFLAGLALIYLGRQRETAPTRILTDLIDKPAPAFELADRQGDIYSLDKLEGKNILLFFNEGLTCYPACWDEMLALAEDQRFAENNTAVLSVVGDDKEQWLKAIAKMPELGQAKILFDTGVNVSRAYGMLNQPSSMHSGTLPGHSYVLIDKEGIIRFAYDDIRMGKNGDQLLDEVKKLK